MKWLFNCLCSKDLLNSCFSNAHINNYSWQVNLWLYLGADPNTYIWRWHGSALHEEAMRGNLTAVKKLIAKGANVNLLDSVGWTALMQAARFGHPEIVIYLLENGADPNLSGDCEWSASHHKNLKGITPLFAALESLGTYQRSDRTRYIKCIEALLSAPTINVNVKVLDYMPYHVTSALTQAIFLDVNIAKVLIKKGADIFFKEFDQEETLLELIIKNLHKMQSILDDAILATAFWNKFSMPYIVLYNARPKLPLDIILEIHQYLTAADLKLLDEQAPPLRWLKDQCCATDDRKKTAFQVYLEEQLPTEKLRIIQTLLNKLEPSSLTKVQPRFRA